MGQQKSNVKKVIKTWFIKILLGYSILYASNKIDKYLDDKLGQNNYSEIITETWNVIKNFF